MAAQVPFAAAPLQSMTAPDMIAPDILRQVPGWEDRGAGETHGNGRPGGSGESEISPLGGVRNNRVFKIETRAGTFALRLQGRQNNQPAVDRRREQTLHSLAAGAGLAPGVLACDPNAGWLLMEFVEGKSWALEDFTDPIRLARLGERLQALHSLPAPALPEFNPLRVLETQAENILQADPAQIAGVKRSLAQAYQAALDLSWLPHRIAVTHGDLDAGNLIGERPMLIDWEYAQLADPIYDIACVLTYYPQAHEHRETLLAAAGLDDPVSKERLAIELRMFEALNDLWNRTLACG